MAGRQLYPLEVEEAKLVFGNTLIYERVKVIEDAKWPVWIAHIGAWISRTPPPSLNAVTLGHTCYFPRQLNTANEEPKNIFINDMSWLIHELIHVWQFQHDGLIYLLQALWVQITLGPNSYGYGWEQGLLEAKNMGKGFLDSNREQQGDIASHYYYRFKQGLDISAWEPFIQEIKTS